MGLFFQVSKSAQLTILILMSCFCFSRQQQVQVSFEDNIVAQPSGGGRWTFPLVCSSNCRYIEWYQTRENGNDVVRFRIRSNVPTVDYISMAISLNTDMFGNDDVYICARTQPGSSEFELRSAYTIGEVAPVIVDQLPVSYYNITVDQDDFICEFIRPLNVSRNISNALVSWNLMGTDFNMLYAEGGEMPSGSIMYHSYRTHTRGEFNYLNNNGYHQQALTQSPAEDTTSGSSQRRSSKHYVIAMAISCIALLAHHL